MTPPFPSKLPGFVMRTAADPSDEKLLSDVATFGWHIVVVTADDEGPGFAFTVGLYLRTLQPEVLIMGIPPDPSMRILNSIGEFALSAGVLTTGKPFSDFLDGFDVVFRPIVKPNHREYLGYAQWFYRSLGKEFPAVQCVWPDRHGVFPWQAGFDESLRAVQSDLSRPAGKPPEPMSRNT